MSNNGKNMLVLLVPKEMKSKYYQFRKRVPTILYNFGQQFGDIYRLWLGHSPGRKMDRFYIEIKTKILDKCIKWLEHEVLLDKYDDLDEITEKTIDE